MSKTEAVRPQRRKLSKVVSSQIEERILVRQYCPGALLPPEMELCQEFGVSRTVVREAIRTLEERGLLHIRHGVGTQVLASQRGGFGTAIASALRQTGCTMGDVLDFRKLVEPEIAAAAARRATRQDLVDMEEALEAFSISQSIGVRGPEAEAHLRFHQTVLRAAHNPVIEALVDPLAEMILLSNLPYTNEPSSEGSIEASIIAHRNIFAAIRAGDSQEARLAMAHDLGTIMREIDWATPVTQPSGPSRAREA